MVLLCLLPACLWGGQLVPLNCASNQFFECSLAPPGGEVGLLSFLLSGSLLSGPVAQAFEQSSSIEFTTPPGFALTEITVLGVAQCDGFFCSAAGGIESPCFASLAANSAIASYAVQPIESGTVTAFIDIHTDVA